MTSLTSSSSSEPYKHSLTVCCECMFGWYWLADACQAAGLKFVLAHALYVKAIHGGKNKSDRVDSGKDRVTVVPESLVERLLAHRERLRQLHEEDRRAEEPGVWLPEGLERKFPQAGKAWEWQWFFPSRQRMMDPRTG